MTNALAETTQLRGSKVVVLCGGRGSSVLTNQLLDLGASVTCLVNAFDDGLSTGRLRQLFSELGPSDLRKNLLSLMDIDAPGYWSRFEVFAYRYPSLDERSAVFRAEVEGICGAKPGGPPGVTRELAKMIARLPEPTRNDIVLYLRAFLDALVRHERDWERTFSFADCALGNCILLGARLSCGASWTQALRELECLLVTRGRIEVASEENRHLFALCRDGRVLPTEFDIITNSDGDIDELFFSKNPVDCAGLERSLGSSTQAARLQRLRAEIHAPTVASAPALDALRAADMIVYGPGTFHSSLLPTLMIDGVAAAIDSSSARKIMVINIAQEPDTRFMSGNDLALRVKNYVGRQAFQYLIVNETKQRRGAGYISMEQTEAKALSAEMIKDDFEDRTRPGRHRGSMLARALLGVAKAKAVPLTPSQAAQPLVSIVMLAWNRKEEVLIGLAELSKSTYPNVETILVDNGSTDGTAQAVYDQFPRVNVVRMHSNTGMTGYNVGFATARGKYVVMLDDDSHLAPEAVETMVTIWEQDRERNIGAMAFRVTNPLRGTLVTHLWEERLVVSQPGRERDITSFAACGAAVRRDVLDEVGYFDDDFFIYATEDDLAIRIWGAGYRIVYEPRCSAYHRESRKQRSWRRYGRGFRNAAWFNIKHLPWRFLPTMMVRNLFWLVARSIRYRSFQYFLYGLVGYVQGYLQFPIALSKRRVVASDVARFCVEDDWITRPIFRTMRRIVAERRYILDKRGVSP
jgi:GT2 family glycosyltransferase/2-phospho-L-lactate transferase/gluconeogenesis factor (CofD/UPF0052 family)